ncbi:MAG: ROK family protein [Candidatus Neomarinimicrobiota bacterium]
MKRVGIDIGGTKIEAVVIDRDGSVLIRERVLTERHKGYGHILEQISSLRKNLLRYFEDDFSLGICVPGPLNARGDKMKQSNTQALVGKSLKNDIEEIFGTIPVLENDANCFTQAEASVGAGKNMKMVFGVIFGTGVGGGIAIDGNVYKGKQHLAGEWGHSILHPEGKDCLCGKKGCVEQYLSGIALEKLYYDMTGNSACVTDIAKNPPSQWKTEFLNNFGMAVSNIINILDPEIIVIGGGVSKVDFLYTDGLKFVKRYCLDKNFKTPIVKNTMGDSAGVFGAAYLS